MKITRAVVPSLFTTLNVFCGFLAIVHTHEGNLLAAAAFIGLAAVFDTLDGMMARITKSSSQFGVELDSLADVVSFGAAPAFLVFKASLHELGNPGLLIAALPLMFGAIRLARFNVQLVGFDKDYFNGLPIPMQALTVCAFIFQYYSETNGLTGWPKDALAPLVIVLSLLMVSTIKYDTLPKFSKRQLAAHPWKAVSVVVALLVVLFSKATLLFHVLAAFIVFGIGRAVVNAARRHMTPQQSPTVQKNELSGIDI